MHDAVVIERDVNVLVVAQWTATAVLERFTPGRPENPIVTGLDDAMTEQHVEDALVGGDDVEQRRTRRLRQQTQTIERVAAEPERDVGLTAESA
ncbi:MAG TPA: hypothetical protein VGF99_00095, partial [Myxococcota bacterium]